MLMVRAASTKRWWYMALILKGKLLLQVQLNGMAEGVNYKLAKLVHHKIAERAKLTASSTISPETPM